MVFGRHPLEGYMTSERDEQNQDVGRTYMRQPEEMGAHSDLANFLLLPGHIYFRYVSSVPSKISFALSVHIPFKQSIL